jgi:hypothetical protein
MGCISCGRGWHDECLTKCFDCHPVALEVIRISTIGRPLKDPTYMLDPESTGRKRAALLYPLNKDNPGPCDWSRKKNCGGGLHPIVGCKDGFQKNRHHGPIKNTIRNEMGNVHLICPTCHNRWHTLNDNHYDEELYSTLPHKPEPATDAEILESEVYWATKKKLRNHVHKHVEETD